MKNFCIVTNKVKDTNLELTKRVTEFLSSKGASVYYAEGYDGMAEDCNLLDPSKLPENIECCLVLGGDGTIIQTAHDIEGLNIPIIGVNLGTLGYLSSIEKADIEHDLQALINDSYDCETRMMLKAVPNGGRLLRSTALNDIVISRVGHSNMISVSLYVNDSLVSEFTGDGVIVSTPTGSTGYNLSAGGPYVTPEAELMVITPICPHSLYSRSIVVMGRDKVTLKLEKRKIAQTEEAVATIDGLDALIMKPGDGIDITQSPVPTKLVRIKPQSFFELLHDKMEQRGRVY